MTTRRPRQACPPGHRPRRDDALETETVHETPAADQSARQPHRPTPPPAVAAYEDPAARPGSVRPPAIARRGGGRPGTGRVGRLRQGRASGRRCREGARRDRSLGAGQGWAGAPECSRLLLPQIGRPQARRWPVISERMPGRRHLRGYHCANLLNLPTARCHTPRRKTPGLNLRGRRPPPTHRNTASHRLEHVDD